MDGRFAPDNQAELSASPYFDQGFPRPGRDIAKAKDLLRQAGFDRASVSLRTLNTPSNMQIGEVLPSMAAEAGIECKAIAGETNVNIAAMNAGNLVRRPRRR
jgi:peptide/nickel transport system substrate-binding protein